MSPERLPSPASAARSSDDQWESLLGTCLGLCLFLHTAPVLNPISLLLYIRGTGGVNVKENKPGPQSAAFHACSKLTSFRFPSRSADQPQVLSAATPGSENETQAVDRGLCGALTCSLLWWTLPLRPRKKFPANACAFQQAFKTQAEAIAQATGIHNAASFAGVEIISAFLFADSGRRALEVCVGKWLESLTQTRRCRPDEPSQKEQKPSHGEPCCLSAPPCQGRRSLRIQRRTAQQA